MRFGVCTGLENAKLLASVGFDYLEIHTCNMMALDEATFATYCGENEAAPIHAEVANCLIPGNMTLIGPDVDSARIHAYIRRVMARLAVMKISTLVFGSGGCRKIPEGFPESAAWTQMQALCAMMAAEASPYGITVALEPLRFAETNMVNFAATGRKLVEEVNHPNFRLLCDLYHFYQVDDSLSDLVCCGDALAHVHIAKPDDRRAMYPGDGMDYRGFFEVLHKIGYDGRVSFEGTLQDMVKELPGVLQVLKAQ